MSAAGSGRAVSVGLCIVSFAAVVSAASCATGVPASEVAGVYLNLGNAYFDLNRFDAAVTAYLNALKLDPALDAAGYNLARVYVESGQIDRGMAILDGLLAEEPENSVLRATKGWALYRKGDVEGALAAYTGILDRIPNDENALYNSAVLAERLGDPEQAVARYRALQEAKPAQSNLRHLGRLLLDLSRPDEALGVLELYVEKDAADAGAYIMIGRAQALERYYDRALQAYERAIEIDGKDPVPRYERAEILVVHIEDMSRGLEALEEAFDRGFVDKKRLAGLLASIEQAGRIADRNDLGKLLERRKLLPDPTDGPESSQREEETADSTDR